MTTVINNFKLIDMICPNCGGETEASDELKKANPEKFGTNKVQVYASKDALDPMIIECKYCNSKQMIWFQGVKTKEANLHGTNIIVKGNLSGNIVIGNGNRVG